MINAAHLVLVASVVAAGFVLATRASAISASAQSPAILTIVHAETEATNAKAGGDNNDAAEGDDSETVGGSGLFANNRVHIQDSRIVLTADDRKQLLQSIAKALVADQLKATNTTAVTTPSLLALSRDAFLYLKADGVVRLGWRYPLATWQIYKDFMVTDACEVKRVVGGFYYC